MDYQQINRQNIGRWEETLKYLTTTLDNNSITYYLSASGLHYILGSKIYPYDIDLFMPEENIKQAFELLKKFSTSDLHKWENKYLEFQGIYNNIPFEICEWEEIPKEIKSAKFKDLIVCIVG